LLFHASLNAPFLQFNGFFCYVPISHNLSFWEIVAKMGQKFQTVSENSYQLYVLEIKSNLNYVQGFYSGFCLLSLHITFSAVVRQKDSKLSFEKVLRELQIFSSH